MYSLDDQRQFRNQDFSWDQVQKGFTWHSRGRINIAHECIDRWAADDTRPDRKALVFESGGRTSQFTYRDLREISSHWASLLLDQGFSAVDRLVIFLPPCPEAFFAMLACARLGVIFCPVHHTIDFHTLELCIRNAQPRGILTHPSLASRLPKTAMDGVERLFFIDDPLPGIFPGEVAVAKALEELPKRSQIRWVKGTSPLYIIYVPSTTGPPKGIVHSHMDMVGHIATAKQALDIKTDTTVWVDANPAWVTGTVYGAFAPWLCGATVVHQGDRFVASTWYRTVERHGIEVWYTTPWTIRGLMEAGDDLPGRYDLSKLRLIATVGDTLTPEIFHWTCDNLKRTPHDTWWMTETGMICLAHSPTIEPRPGSLGKPVPGIEAAALDENGVPVPDDTLGELALRPGWPAMMTGIWRDAPRFQEYFRFKDWFLTGDMVTRDQDGYYYYQGRKDDVIKAAGKRLGPEQIEHALSLHPDVDEAVAIAVASPSGRNDGVEVFVTVRPGSVGSQRLAVELEAILVAKLSQSIPLRGIRFIPVLPKTRSGKLLRRALRAKLLDLPLGDFANLKE